MALREHRHDLLGGDDRNVMFHGAPAEDDGDPATPKTQRARLLNPGLASRTALLDCLTSQA
jgi:hypothetical protein